MHSCPNRVLSPRRPAAPGAACRVLVAGLLLVAAGCAGSRLLPPKIVPESAARQALEQYDSNKNGALEAAELNQCPALKGSLKSLDKNGDGRLTAQEITDRIASYQTNAVGLVAFPVKVLVGNNPLAGATVTFVPEKFLGPDVKPASGVTDAHGVAQLQTAGAPVPGIAYGFYRVEVSKKGAGGQELVPARYNTQTVLGQEVAPDSQGGTVRLRLSGF